MALRRLALVVWPAHRCRLRATNDARAPVNTIISKKIDFTVEEEARDFLDVSSVFLDSFWADKAGSQENSRRRSGGNCGVGN